MVIDVLGVRKEDFTTGSDVTLLQEEEVNLLVWEGAIIANQQLRQWNEAEIMKKELQTAIELYMQKFPSQEDIESFTYYNI